LRCIGNGIVETLAGRWRERAEKDDLRDVALCSDEWDDTATERVPHEDDALIDGGDIAQNDVSVGGPSSVRVVAGEVHRNALMTGRFDAFGNGAPAPTTVPSSVNQYECRHEVTENDRPP
jgi:hypothetical protein